MKIAVLRGGRSSEHDVSLRSGSAVASGLRDAGHETVDVLIERDGRWLADGDEVELRPGGGLLGCDAAFPVLHGPGGEDGTVQGTLEVLDIPYAGSDVPSSAICLDKIVFKRLLGEYGVPQVEFTEAGAEGWEKRAAELGTPLWVKPARLGSSVGITKVTDPGELEAAYFAARKHDPKVIVEADGGGKEVECSLLGHAELQASTPGEIVAHADWYDYEAKYDSGGMDLVIPAEISETATETLRETAKRVFRICGCSGLARCDFFVDGETVLVNELNTIPGFTETSVYGKLLEADGIPYAELCAGLVQLALEKYREQRSYEF